MNSIAAPDSSVQSDKPGLEVRKVIAYTASCDVRWFSRNREIYRIRLRHPDELFPEVVSDDATFVLVVLIPGRGLLRFPLTSDEAAAVRARSEDIAAAAVARKKVCNA